MLKVFLIGLGGFAGAVSRYLVSGLVYRLPGTEMFPYGTLVVNMIGCLLIGLGGGLMESRQLFSPEARSFIFIGLLGGFTTFSTFAFESFNLTREGQLLATASNVLAHVLLGLAMVWLGNVIARAV